MSFFASAHKSYRAYMVLDVYAYGMVFTNHIYFLNFAGTFI